MIFFVFWGGGVNKRDEHDLLPKLFLEFVEELWVLSKLKRDEVFLGGKTMWEVFLFDKSEHEPLERLSRCWKEGILPFLKVPFKSTDLFIVECWCLYWKGIFLLLSEVLSLTFLVTLFISSEVVCNNEERISFLVFIFEEFPLLFPLLLIVLWLVLLLEKFVWQYIGVVYEFLFELSQNILVVLLFRFWLDIFV